MRALCTGDVINYDSCGPDVDAHVKALLEYADAGYDKVYVGQMGDEREPFVKFCKSEVLRRLR